MNPKIQKVISDIEKTNAKIKELQTLLPQLEKQKIDLENAEVITLFRSSKVSPDDFADFIRMYQERVTANKHIESITNVSGNFDNQQTPILTDEE